MPRATVLLFSLLVTTTAAAKTADLRVTRARLRLTVPADLRPRQWITATLTTPSSTAEFGPALETQ